LEVLEYCDSHTLVEQMITPPPRFNRPVVLWSNLRVLTLAPHDNEGMAYLQPILDATCNTLEELYLTGFMHVGVAISDNTKRLLTKFLLTSSMPLNCWTREPQQSSKPAGIFSLHHYMP
jgi:hypothetical protein